VEERLKTIQLLARDLVAEVTAHGVSKETASDLNALMVRSVGTERAYRLVIFQYLRWLRDLRIEINSVQTTDMMLEFLDDYSECHRQKSVDQARQALQKVFSVSLSLVESAIETVVYDRSYNFDELEQIIGHQTFANQLGSLLAFDAGLRAHECITIRRRDEGSPSDHREWSPLRFRGLTDFVIYLVVGKGGLTREIALSRELSDLLLTRERPTPIIVRDREVNYESWFDIGGGQALSQSFTRASKLALGWSSGLHGLRHSFARRRMATLLTLFPPREALLILSQELGHFRPAATLCYLGGR
jgi:integrase